MKSTKSNPMKSRPSSPPSWPIPGIPAGGRGAIPSLGSAWVHLTNWTLEKIHGGIDPRNLSWMQLHCNQWNDTNYTWNGDEWPISSSSPSLGTGQRGARENSSFFSIWGIFFPWISPSVPLQSLPETGEKERNFLWPVTRGGLSWIWEKSMEKMPQMEEKGGIFTLDFSQYQLKFSLRTGQWKIPLFSPTWEILSLHFSQHPEPLDLTSSRWKKKKN